MSKSEKATLLGRLSASIKIKFTDYSDDLQSLRPRITQGLEIDDVALTLDAA